MNQVVLPINHILDPMVLNSWNEFDMTHNSFMYIYENM